VLHPPCLIWHSSSTSSHGAAPPPPPMACDIGSQGYRPSSPSYGPWHRQPGAASPPLAMVHTCRQPRAAPSYSSLGARHRQQGATAPPSLAMGLRMLPLLPRPPPGPMTDAWSGVRGSSGRRRGAHGSGGRSQVTSSLLPPRLCCAGASPSSFLRMGQQREGCHGCCQAVTV
jgi:hypothetical protein